MQSYTPHQYVEQFHLLFLDQLGQKLDKRLYVLKGGCNLRFYCNSIRYSEDIDLDVTTVSKETLTKKINTIITSTPFEKLLLLRGIKIAQYSTPKQTSTTQRWKVLLKANNIPLPLNTKIEFSRRGINDEIQFDQINTKLIQLYKLTPIFIPHYAPDAAFKQKILALINRAETQARDVFDIHLLLQQLSPGLNALKKFSDNEKQIAINNTMEITLDHFNSQVLTYLEPQYQAQYNDPVIWEKIQLSIIELLS